jgi:hypothetical protein
MLRAKRFAMDLGKGTIRTIIIHPGYNGREKKTIQHFYERGIFLDVKLLRYSNYTDQQH